MFVQTNSVRSIKEYFKNKLSEKFSDNEIKIITNESVSQRLKISFNQLIGIDDQLLSESDLLYFRSIAKRLLNNEPFQYVVGNAHFYGLELKSDKRALIPRPETEELVEWVKDSFSSSFSGKILDVCTGSGCIALALKSVFRNAEITGADYSADALALAKENALIVNLAIDLLRFDATKEEAYSVIGQEKAELYDCWVSNPPYIPFQDKKAMEENILAYEPHIALFVSDEDPLIFYRVISLMASRYLKQGGLLFFEIHENLSKEVMIVLENVGFINIEIRKDLQGKNRMVKAEKM